jgi:signal transduction histidine kinase
VPETTDFSLHLCRFFYSAASGYFLLSGGLAGLYFLRFREMFARRHFLLCLMLLIYALDALAYTYGPLPSPLDRLVLSSVYVLGPTAFVVYIQMVVQLLHIRPAWLPSLLLPLRILPVAMILDVVFFFVSGKSVFIQEGPSTLWRQSILIVLIPAAVSLLLINGLLLWQYRQRLKHESLLKYGIILIFLTQLHDISLTLFDPRALFPLAFVGYVLEVIRFNMSLLEGYLINNDSMRARLKESLLSFAQVRLSKQILHDVQSIRRNILFKLESSTTPSPLKDILKHEIDRLKVYENGDIKNPKEDLCLADLVRTTVTLFNKEFLDAAVTVKISIPEHLHIKASRNDLLIVLINLIQNSLEALNGQPQQWLKFIASDTPEVVELLVSDSGCISASERGQIFRAGYSSKGSCRGLGLNIVQESLAANNGLISLLDDTEHTTFRIHFHKVR